MSLSFPFNGSFLDLINGYAPKVLAIQYLTVAGLTIAIWDYIVTFPVELRVVWGNRVAKTRILETNVYTGVETRTIASSTGLKVAYLFNRIASIVLLAFYLDMTVTRRPLSLHWCLSVSRTITLGLLFVEAVGHALALYRVFILWDRYHRIHVMLLVGGGAIYTASAVFVGMLIRRMEYGAFYFPPPIGQCYVNIESKVLLAAVLPMIILDVYAGFLVLWNAMERPRSAGDRLLEILKHDGLLLMLTTFVFRTLNACLIGTSDDHFQHVIAISFIQAVTTTINSRLFLKLYDDPVNESTSAQSELELQAQEERVHSPSTKDGSYPHARSESPIWSDTGSSDMNPLSNERRGDTVRGIHWNGVDMRSTTSSTMDNCYAMTNLGKSQTRLM